MNKTVIKEAEEVKGIDALRKTARVETHENVTLSFETANAGSRFAAHFVDSVIMGLIYAAIVLAVFGIAALAKGSWENGFRGILSVFENSDNLLMTVAIAGTMIFAVKYSYFLLWEYFTEGTTPGKRACGLKVVSVTGEAPTFGMIALRNLFRLFHLIPGMKFADGIIIALSGKSMRSGDYAAKTMVIKFRTNSRDFASRMDSILNAQEETKSEETDEDGFDKYSEEPERRVFEDTFFTEEEYYTLKSYYQRRGDVTHASMYDVAWVKLISKKSGAALPPDMSSKVMRLDYMRKAIEYLAAVYENYGTPEGNGVAN